MTRDRAQAIADQLNTLPLMKATVRHGKEYWEYCVQMRVGSAFGVIDSREEAAIFLEALVKEAAYLKACA